MTWVVEMDWELASCCRVLCADMNLMWNDFAVHWLLEGMSRSHCRKARKLSFGTGADELYGCQCHSLLSRSADAVGNIRGDLGTLDHYCGYP